MKEIVLFIGVVFFLISCRSSSLFKDKELTLSRIDYDGEELIVDGYYYANFVKGNGNKAIRIYFLYNNGIILYGSVLSEDTAIDLEEEFRNGEYAAREKNDITSWGVFQIDKDIIKFERWYPSSGGPAPTAIKEGKILNDTTFHIAEEYKMENGKKVEIREVNSIYHFKPFSPKPDSTNTFIK